MAPSTAKEAYVTLCTNDSYAIGVLVWVESLKEVGTTRQIVVMITNGLSQKMKEQLAESADKVVEVNVLDSRDNVNLDLLARPDLGVTFTKLHCWRLTEYDKCVFMDADTLVLKNIDDLFEKEEFSAAPDPGWPDCFNSGVYVYKPSLETYQKLLKFAVQSGSFDGGDQGLLNSYYTNWNRISFLYNCVAQSFYSYLPAFKQFGKDVKVAHFIGAVKPWHHSFDVSTGKVSESEFSGHCADFLRHWWNLFVSRVHKRLPEEISPTFPKEKWSPGIAAGNFQPPSQMQGPYIPPSVETFYSPIPTSNELQMVVELKERKDYDFYETFYAEPPMRTKEEYVAPRSETYTAKEFNIVLQSFGDDISQSVVKEDLPALPKVVEAYESTQPAVPLAHHEPPPMQPPVEAPKEILKENPRELPKEIHEYVDSSASSIPTSPSSISTFKDFSGPSTPRSATPTRIETPFQDSVISHGADIVKAVVENGCSNHKAGDCSFCQTRHEEVVQSVSGKKKKTKKRGRGEVMKLRM
ncbi:DgyrCDS7496 [Dimorphilus gyrociliatus]|uniref:glycogenin glucosyltransferase n=1 Tax=Dimorphilus gyrociliatus TaxID=2664684 RepID=A0A7I8VSW9_9ANNE|nr:DgyrCDS7496 [Dimorphilus gyrociliatus]